MCLIDFYCFFLAFSFQQSLIAFKLRLRNLDFCFRINILECIGADLFKLCRLNCDRLQLLGSVKCLCSDCVDIFPDSDGGDRGFVLKSLIGNLNNLEFYA